MTTQVMVRGSMDAFSSLHAASNRHVKIISGKDNLFIFLVCSYTIIYIQCTQSQPFFNTILNFGC